jgi:hypothetical protein
MAVIAMFYGIIISMYYFDNRRHKKPHIHVKYQENEAVFGIPDGKVIEGEIPANKMKLVQAWIEIHKEDLMADWELASSGQNVFRIDPLK